MYPNKEKSRPWSAPVLRPGPVRIMSGRRRFFCTADDFNIRRKSKSAFRDNIHTLERVAKEMSQLQTSLLNQRLNKQFDNHETRETVSRQSHSARTRLDGELHVTWETPIESDEGQSGETKPNIEDLDNIGNEVSGARDEDGGDGGHMEEVETCNNLEMDGTCMTNEVNSKDSLTDVTEESDRTLNNEADVCEGSMNENNSEHGENTLEGDDDHDGKVDEKASNEGSGSQVDEQSDVAMEMTFEEKEAMYEAVKKGDIDLLEDLLDLRNADLQMEWYNTNLLMVAIRHNQVVMAHFLLDNGVNPNFESILMNMNFEEEKIDTYCEVYRTSCRQMAYDRGMMDVVENIDIINGNLPSYLTPRPREIRLRRPPKPPSEVEEDEDDDDEDSSGGESADDEDESSQTEGAKTKSCEKLEKDQKNKQTLKKNKDSLVENLEPVPPNEPIERMDFVDEWRRFKCTPDDIDEEIADDNCTKGTNGFPNWVNPTVQEYPEPVKYRETKSHNMRKLHTSLKSYPSIADKFIDRSKVNCKGSYHHESRNWSSNNSQTSKQFSVKTGRLFPSRHIGAFSDTNSMYSSAYGSTILKSVFGSAPGSHFVHGSQFSGKSSRKTKLSVENGPLYENKARHFSPAHLWNPNQRKAKF